MRMYSTAWIRYSQQNLQGEKFQSLLIKCLCFRSGCYLANHFE